VQRLLFVVILGLMVIGFPILISGDTSMPTHETDIPNNDVAVTTNETGNSSVSATITITMTGMADQ
jgi:hypothetical protein